MLRDTVDVYIHTKDGRWPNNISRILQKCSERQPKDSWIEPRPTGYAKDQKWIFKNYCANDLIYDRESLIGCLKGKTVTLIGDSTLRQYLETLAGIMNLRVPSFDVGREFNKTVVSIDLNIHISWRKHEMPFHNEALFMQEGVQSTSYQIDKLADDTSTPGNESIVIVHYGSHLQAFHPSVFRNRLRILAGALLRLLAKKPSTKIFVKGAAPVIVDKYWFDVKIALIFDEILHQEFAGLQDRVVYLDVFSIMIANNMELLHPTGQAMDNQIQQLMAYIC